MFKQIGSKYYVKCNLLIKLISKNNSIWPKKIIKIDSIGRARVLSVNENKSYVK
jgi:hypothetical protein